MDQDFNENIAFKSLIEGYIECDETSAIKFLSSDWASYCFELIQDVAGESIDIIDSEIMEDLQEELIYYIENNFNLQFIYALKYFAFE